MFDLCSVGARTIRIPRDVMLSTYAGHQAFALCFSALSEIASAPSDPHGAVGMFGARPCGWPDLWGGV
eukprot:8771845-Alexandrium_andersonii.AAC.1